MRPLVRYVLVALVGLHVAHSVPTPVPDWGDKFGPGDGDNSTAAPPPHLTTATTANPNEWSVLSGWSGSNAKRTTYRTTITTATAAHTTRIPVGSTIMLVLPGCTLTLLTTREVAALKQTIADIVVKHSAGAVNMSDIHQVLLGLLTNGTRLRRHRARRIATPTPPGANGNTTITIMTTPTTAVSTVATIEFSTATSLSQVEQAAAALNTAIAAAIVVVRFELQGVQQFIAVTQAVAVAHVPRAPGPHDSNVTTSTGTREAGSRSQSSNSSEEEFTVAVIVGVIGAVLVILLVVVAGVWHREQQRFDGVFQSSCCRLQGSAPTRQPSQSQPTRRASAELRTEMAEAARPKDKDNLIDEGVGSTGRRSTIAFAPKATTRRRESTA